MPWRIRYPPIAPPPGGTPGNDIIRTGWPFRSGKPKKSDVENPVSNSTAVLEYSSACPQVAERSKLSKSHWPVTSAFTGSVTVTAPAVLFVDPPRYPTTTEYEPASAG